MVFGVETALEAELIFGVGETLSGVGITLELPF